MNARLLLLAATAALLARVASSGTCTGRCVHPTSYYCTTGWEEGDGLCDDLFIKCCTGKLIPLPQSPQPTAAAAAEAVPAAANGYNRANAVAYADRYWNTANHDCSSAYTSCTPYSYWGDEHCGYASHGGDCANFVSQCLLAGGHAPLSGGAPCRGYPCGNEEVGAKNLGDCLAGYKGWTRSCGYHMAPPSSITTGDVLIYHAGSCDGWDAHATIVTSTTGGVKISCHSNDRHNEAYTYLASSKPYYEWLHKN
eukprot:m51a1_g14316 hypothetical protein (253) ;mRNA; f:10494-11331